MTADEIQQEIVEKKQLLTQSDYETTKSVERFLLEAKEATTVAGLIKAIKGAIDDFAELFEQRQGWRDRINELQAMEHEPAADDAEAQ